MYTVYMHRHFGPAGDASDYKKKWIWRLLLEKGLQLSM